MRYMMSVLMVLMLAVNASAQSKPYGAFDVGVECKNIPEWIVFSGLPSYSDQAEMAKAAQCSHRTGMKWVLKFGFDQIGNTEQLAREARTRAQLAGLLPYIVALQFNEEIYSQPQYDTSSFAARDAIYAYVSEQQRLLKLVFGLPIIYVDDLYNSNKVFGLGYYKPLPAHTDYFGMETYVPKGGSWEANVQPIADYLLAQNDGIPVVLIAQTFKHPKVWNDQWQDGPRPGDGEKFKRLMQHPKVFAAWLFTWKNRPNGIIGAESLKDVVGWFR